VTNIVSERHAEAVRLGKIDRVVSKFKQAGDVSPRRKDDVFMWTDKVVSNERIPKEVRAYLDNPESVAKLSPDEQTSMFDKIKDATFEKQDWRNPEKVAEFEKLAEQGKGVFVPRKLLGEFAKRSYSSATTPASSSSTRSTTRRRPGSST
jgi:ribosomal protein L18E